MLNEALELSQAVGYRYYLNTIHGQLAWLALVRGDLALARTQARLSLQTTREAGAGPASVQALQLAARVAIADGEPGRGTRWLAAVTGWQLRQQPCPDQTLWISWSVPGNAAALAAALASARTTLGEEEFALTWARGVHLSLDHVLDEALASVGQEAPG